MPYCYEITTTGVFWPYRGLETMESGAKYKIVGADPTTFTVLNRVEDQYLSHCFGKDAVSVYQGSLKIEQADPETFSIVAQYTGRFEDMPISKDARRLYAGTTALLPIPDLSTFIVLNPHYAKTDGVVYYIGTIHQEKVSAVEGAEAATFTLVKDGYAKDAQRVYLNGIKIPEADPATFIVFHFEGNTPTLGEASSWSKDAYHVYRNHVIVQSADPATFAYGNGYGRDALTLFDENGNSIEINPNTFAPLSAGYDRDSAQVSYYGSVVPGADPTTFEVLDANTPYARDARHIYCGAVQMDTDPYTFESLLGDFGKDAHHVFTGCNIFTSADPESFQFLGIAFDKRSFGPGYSLPSYAKDASHVWYGRTEIPGADPSSFVIFYDGDRAEGKYAQDKDHVFYEGTLLSGADPITFQVLTRPTGQMDAIDATHTFIAGLCKPFRFEGSIPYCAD